MERGLTLKSYMQNFIKTETAEIQFKANVNIRRTGEGLNISPVSRLTTDKKEDKVD